MITPPTNWDTLWQDPESLLEVFLTVKLCDEITVTYSNDRLEQCRLSASVFQDFSIGNACSARLTFTLKDAESEFSQFAKGQRIDFTCRLSKGNTVTAKVNQGVFYIDTVNKTSNGNVTITAYDAMYQLESMVSQQDSGLTVSAYLSKLRSMYPDVSAALVTTNINAYMYDGTRLTALTIPATAGYLPAREVLASVAGFAGGNIYVGKDNKLHFLRPHIAPTQTKNTYTGVLVTATALDHDERPQPITGVTVNQDGGIRSGSGWRIIVNIDDAVFNSSGYNPQYEFARDVVDNMRTNASTGATSLDVKGNNVSAQGVYITPLFELNDIASVDLGGGNYYNFPVYDYEVSYVGGCWGTLNYPKTDQAIEFSIEQQWNTSQGWYDGWYYALIDGGIRAPSATPLSRNMLALSNIPLSNQTYAHSNAIARLGTGFESLTATFHYYSTLNGQYKAIEITAYPAARLCPIGIYMNDKFSVQNILYYCDTLPDDVPLNTALVGNFKIRTENAASQEGYKLVYIDTSN